MSNVLYNLHLLRVRKIPGSNLGPETCYRHWSLSRLTSVLPRKFRESALHYTTTDSFHILSSSLTVPSLDAIGHRFWQHRYTNLSTPNASQWRVRRSWNANKIELSPDGADSGSIEAPARSAFGGSLESGLRYCAHACWGKLASVAVKMFFSLMICSSTNTVNLYLHCNLQWWCCNWLQSSSTQKVASPSYLTDHTLCKGWAN
jgi:hypothetical protein